MNTVNLRTPLGIFPFLVSVPLWAAPPIGYDGWSVTAGTIDAAASCGGAWTCKTLSADNGFLQQEVSDGTQRFVRIIMTDPDANGDPALSGAVADLAYTNETYTPLYTNSDCNAIPDPQDCQGMAGKAVVRDLALDFELVAALQRNFAKSNEATLDGMYNIDIMQTTDTIDPNSGLAFFDQFKYRDWSYWECTVAGSCNNSVKIGSSMDLSQDIATDPLDASRKQVFEQRKRDGWQGRQSGGWYLSGPVVDTGGATLSLDLGGTTSPVLYNSQSGFSDYANTLETVYLASNTELDGFVSQSVSHEGFDGTTAGVSASAARMELDPEGRLNMPLDPFAWDPASFGSQPTF